MTNHTRGETMVRQCYRHRILRASVVLLTGGIVLGLAPRTACAQYRGPLVFRGQVFSPVTRGTIPQTPIARSTITFQPIQRSAFTRGTIPREAFVFAPITRDTFTFSGSLYGPVDEGPARAPGSSYVHPKLRPQGPGRRRSLGW